MTRPCSDNLPPFCPFRRTTHTTIQPYNNNTLTIRKGGDRAPQIAVAPLPQPDHFSLTHSLIHSFTHSLIHSFTHSLIHSFTHSLIHSLPPSLTHSPAHVDLHFSSLSLTQSLAFCRWQAMRDATRPASRHPALCGVFYARSTY